MRKPEKLRKCSGCYALKPRIEFDFKANGFLKFNCRECCQTRSRKHRKRYKKYLVRRYRTQTKYWDEYAIRNQILKDIGFASYSDYLQSDLWRSIRADVFELHGNECYLCGFAASQIHHNKYTKNNLSGENLSYMYPVCGRCHKDIEFDEHDKLSVQHAKNAFVIKRKNYVGYMLSRLRSVIQILNSKLKRWQQIQ